MGLDICTLPVSLDNITIDSRFRLVTVAAQQARIIMEKEKGKVNIQKKATIRAIELAATESLEFKVGEDALKALELHRRKSQKTNQKSIYLVEENIASEVRKDLDSYLDQSVPLMPVNTDPGAETSFIEEVKEENGED